MLHWFCHHCQLVSPPFSSSLCSPRCSVMPPVPDSRATLHIPSSLTCWLHLTSGWLLSKGEFFSLSVPFMTWPIPAFCSVSDCSLPDPLLLTTDIHNKDSACPLLPWSPWQRSPWTHQPRALPDICSHAWSELLLFPDLPWGPCLCDFSVYPTLCWDALPTPLWSSSWSSFWS